MMGFAALLCVLSLLEAVAGTALDNSTIRTAVAAWLSDSAAAEATYGHISTWETGGVTDMSYLFCSQFCGSNTNSAAASFNEDISAWDTSGVTTMESMFYRASAFNRDISGWAVHSVKSMYAMFDRASAFDQDIGDWAVDSVTNMVYMFYHAWAFNQDLGWCVDTDFYMYTMFSGTQCESTSCGVKQVAGGCAPTPAPTVSPLVADDSTIRTAVDAWLADPTAAEAAYGHISTWETGGVTDMSYLFCGDLGYAHLGCNSGKASFNEDIGAWDTSGVTSMHGMFWGASSFNQNIGGWAVHSVKGMFQMFHRASAFNQDIGAWDTSGVTAMNGMFNSAFSFNQDLGWCVDDDVNLDYAFYNTPCSSTSCGVVRCPTKENDREQTPVAIIAGAAAAALLLAVGAFCFYRRRKASMMDKADEPSGANPEPTELSAPEEATSPKEEEATIPVAPEGEEASTEQPPPPPPRRWFSRAEPEPAAPKAEEMYNQIAAWYNAPENAALRATWGAYPEPDDFQTWPGFVAVTNAFLDREAG